MRPASFLSIVVIGSLLLGDRVSGWSASDRNPADAKISLEVPCGAGLQPAMDEIGQVYFQRTGVRVDFS